MTATESLTQLRCLISSAIETTDASYVEGDADVIGGLHRVEARELVTCFIPDLDIEEVDPVHRYVEGSTDGVKWTATLRSLNDEISTWDVEARTE